MINSSSPGRFDAYSVIINTLHITQAPHILHSGIDHSRLMDTLPHSFSITGAMLKRCVFPLLPFCKTKEVIKPCHSVYLLTIYLLKGQAGNLEEKLSQFERLSSNFTNLILLFLHKTDQTMRCVSGKEPRTVHCPANVGIYMSPCELNFSIYLSHFHFLRPALFIDVL